MAATIKPDYAMDLGTGKTIRTNPLKETDIEPWVKSDHDRAQLLLATYFHEEPFDNTEMRNLLKEHIGQDWASIDSAIGKYQQSIKKTIQTTDTLIDLTFDAWKKMPKDQALKEAIALYRNQGLEPAEKRIKLDVLKFISELQGALVPAIPQGMHVVSIEVITPGQRQNNNIIDIKPEKIQ